MAPVVSDTNEFWHLVIDDKMMIQARDIETPQYGELISVGIVALRRFLLKPVIGANRG